MNRRSSIYMYVCIIILNYFLVSFLSESRKFSLLQTRASSSEETSTTVDASELFTDWKQKARSLPIGWFREFSFILNFLLVNA